MVKAIENSFNEASLPIYFNNVQRVLSLSIYLVNMNRYLDTRSYSAKIRLSIKTIFSKCEHVQRELRISSDLLKIFSMGNFLL